MKQSFESAWKDYDTYEKASHLQSQRIFAGELPTIFVYACSLNPELKNISDFENLLKDTFETLEISCGCYLANLNTIYISGTEENLQKIKTCIENGEELGQQSHAGIHRSVSCSFTGEHEEAYNHFNKVAWDALCSSGAQYSHGGPKPEPIFIECSNSSHTLNISPK